MRKRRATRDGIERLYRDQFPKFVRVAESIVGSREKALDAVQDGFANALRASDEFRGDGPLEAWVWRCVVNAARLAARTRPEVLSDLEQAAPEHQLAVEISPLLSSLPERQRTAVFLRYYVGLDYRAIGEAMEIEVGTVSATLASAHAALRKRLKEAEARV